MSGAVAIGALVVAAAGLGYTVYNGERMDSEQGKAQAKAKLAANKSAYEADQANNMANKKSPNSNAIMAAAQQAAKGGVAGTMLTGSQGVDPGALSLGKTNLLGG